ncbi:MAG: DUF3194 domain-containing protein [Methanobacteriaceae archaeon]|nr:DUF3194 domain-containing protein [Methanobacteriaceae archaeon]
MNKLKKLSSDDLSQISDFAVTSAQNFVYKRISKKEIIDLDINAQITYEDELDVDIRIEFILDDLCSADEGLADAAVEYAMKKLEKYLDDHYRL